MEHTTQKVHRPDVYASCPHVGNILEYYRGYFEAVYVVLHPFIKFDDFDPEKLEDDDWPGKLEHLAGGASGINWREVAADIGVDSLQEVGHGLHSLGGRYKQDYQNRDLSVRISNYMEKKDILLPWEGSLCPLLENRLFRAIQSLGYEQLWVGDEFAFERKLHWIADLLEQELVPRSGNVFTRDHSLLLTTHWDSYFSLLCSSRSNLERILEQDEIEGFFCTDRTEIDWPIFGI